MAKNFAHLIREELVKRFEDVVKEEMRRTTLYIQDNDKKMDVMSHLLKTLMDEIEGIKADRDRTYLKVCEKIDKDISSIKEDFEQQRKFIRSNAKNVTDIGIELNTIIHGLVTREEMGNLAEEMQENMREVHVKGIEQAENLSEEMQKSFYTFYGDLSSLKENCAMQLDEIMQILHSLEKTVDVNRVDAEGVLRELRIYKKSMLILEKHIEFLMTRLDRISEKRG